VTTDQVPADQVPSPFLTTDMSDRHRAYAELTRSGPVHEVTLPHGSPAWLVTGYHEARAALVDPRFAAVETPLAHLLDPALRAATESSMLSMDGPGHARLRKLVMAAFTRRQVERLAPRIQQITDELLAPLAERGSPFDLLEEFAYPLPVAVICELLGVPEDRRGDFGKWSQITVNSLVVGVEALSAALTEFVSYLRELIALKRAEPGDDLATALIAARDGGDRLSEDELTSMMQLLLVAGHETTVNLVASAVHALLSTPGAWDLLRAEPERVPAVVEEALRFNGPVQTATERVVTEDVEIAGTTIPAGAHVRVALLAGNRDPKAWPAAEEFDVTRPPGPHLAFGHGIHLCVGAPLARLEGRIALTSLLGTFPGLRLAVPPQDVPAAPGVLMNGFATMPVVPGPTPR
jgi:cytochrome P450